MSSRPATPITTPITTPTTTLATAATRLPPTHLHLLSGALSGLTSCLLLQPLDLLKTRVQQGHPRGFPAAAKTQTVVEATRDVWKTDGVFGLWRGTTPTVLRNVPGVAAYFWTLTELRTAFTRLPYLSQRPATSTTSAIAKGDANRASMLPKLTPTGDLIAGATARTSVGFIMMPITVLKARFESNIYAYPSMRAAVASMLSAGGFRSLFAGYLPTVLRDAPYAALFVTSYERAKALVLLYPRASDALAPSAVHALSGGIGAAAATVLTTPFDYLKTQQQLRPAEFKGFWPSCAKVVRERGWKGFFDGASLRIARKAASSAVGWTIYEGLIRRWAQK